MRDKEIKLSKEASTIRHTHEFCPCGQCNNKDIIESGLIKCIKDGCFFQKRLLQIPNTKEEWEEPTEIPYFIDDKGIKHENPSLRISNTKRQDYVGNCLKCGHSWDDHYLDNLSCKKCNSESENDDAAKYSGCTTWKMEEL